MIALLLTRAAQQEAEGSVACKGGEEHLVEYCVMVDPDRKSREESEVAFQMIGFAEREMRP